MTPVVKTRIILDTNTLVSGIIFKGPVLRRLVEYAIDELDVIFSPDTWDELALVFQCEKFEQILSLGTRLAVLAELATRVTVLHSTTVVTHCRDPKDDKFLALALDAQVATIVSGDTDLRASNPWRGVRILSPEEFLLSELLHSARE
jgi:uncharacterized protein